MAEVNYALGHIADAAMRATAVEGNAAGAAVVQAAADTIAATPPSAPFMSRATAGIGAAIDQAVALGALPKEAAVPAFHAGAYSSLPPSEAVAQLTAKVMAQLHVSIGVEPVLTSALVPTKTSVLHRRVGQETADAWRYLRTTIERHIPASTALLRDVASRRL